MRGRRMRRGRFHPKLIRRDPMETLRPTTEDEAIEAVGWACQGEHALEIVSGGSKRGLGRPAGAAALLDLSGLAGIALYEPEELVLTARPGTTLAEIDARLAQHGQALAFEPPDLGPVLGAGPGLATLGGCMAANLSGPRRFKSGAARDHILGVRAVSGRGELFKSGGRVVKNVTGYDLCKLLAGSWGTLAAMTEITVKVLPAAEKLRTVLVYGLDDEAAVDAMTRALGGPFEVSGAAHLPAGIAALSGVGRVRDPGSSVTALRIEGPEPSVLARTASLRGLFADGHALDELHGHNSSAFWREVGEARFHAAGEAILWRLSVPPAGGAAVAGRIADAFEVRAFYDWGGGLVWLALPPGAEDAGAEAVRAALGPAGGHATLIRAPEEVRRRVPVFHPQPPGLAALSERVKQAFDPRNILNPGRMGGGR